MKKIFLLSLLSVFFLSVFCQNTDGSTEIINKINITKYIDDSEIPVESMYYIWPPFYYKYISYDPYGGVRCTGYGPMRCIFVLKDVLSAFNYRNLPIDAMEKTCETFVEESNELITNGEYKGSLSKKIAFPDPQLGGKLSFILLQMSWDNDPQKPYNGKAEIIISKTNDFGIR